MNGVLVVDKPAGPTSHDVVARVRRALAQSRIGHTGTLDPLATGVLPLVVGRACRLAQFLSADEKAYLASVRFGEATATYDAEGRSGSGAGAATRAPAEPEGVSAETIEGLLQDFRGSYQQTPPPFSAKKIGGVAAYKLARSERPVEVPPVTVTVHALELLSYDAGLARLNVVCSSGFYVRTLAHELGQRLRCGAYLEGLRRVRAGDFSLDDAVALDTIQAEGLAAAGRLISMSALLPGIPPVVLTEAGARRACHGSALTPGDLVTAAGAPSSTSQRFRLIDGAGTLVGIGEPRADGLLHPVIVLV
jgi:tRNA pseudouridine55 synthase